MLRLGRASTWPNQIIDGEGPLLTTDAHSSGTDSDRSHILGLTTTLDRDEHHHIPGSERHSQPRQVPQADEVEEHEDQGDSSSLLQASENGAHQISESIDELQRDNDSPSGPLSLHVPASTTFEAIPPPPGYPTLDYLPTILTPKVTMTCTIFYLSVLAGLVVLYMRTDATSPYIIHDVNLYLAARYCPAIIAIITTTVVKTTIQEFRRMLPYLNMADRGGRATSLGGQYSMAAAYWPLQHQTNSVLTLGLPIFVLVTSNLIAYKSLLVQILHQNGAWAVIVHTRSGIGVALMAYYAAIACLTASITIRLSTRSTGLRKDWNPSSLADMLALLHWCEFDANQTENLLSQSDHKTNLAYAKSMVFRLGYWKRIVDGTAQVVYGIRVLQSMTPDARPSSRRNPKHRSTQYPYLYSPLIHRGWLSFYSFLATAVLGLLAYVAYAGFLIQGFQLTNSEQSMIIPLVRRDNLTVSGITEGWVGFVNTPQANELLRVSFTFRALPIIVMSSALGYCISLDAHHRYLQPFLNMSRRPCKADESILLKYLTMSPLGITQVGFGHGHWRVVYFSILAAISDTLILIPWSILAITSTGSGFVGHFSPIPYGATCLVLISFIASCALAWPRDSRKLPRERTTLLDIWAMCHASRLATLPEFGKCTPTWTQQDLMATIQLRQDRYLLGVCHGADGRDRLGFDIVTQGRICEPTEYVTRVKPKKFWRWFFWRMWRHQRLQKQSDFEMEEGPFVSDGHTSQAAAVD